MSDPKSDDVAWQGGKTVTDGGDKSYPSDPQFWDTIYGSNPELPYVLSGPDEVSPYWSHPEHVFDYSDFPLARDLYFPWSGSGNNWYILSGNRDEFFGSHYDESVWGGALADTLWGRGGHDQLFGEAGNDYLYGGEGHDALFGGEGNDVLFGEEGNDYLVGGTGDDFLDGNGGNDILNGGDGRDSLDMILVAWNGTAYDDVEVDLETGRARVRDEVDRLSSIENATGGGGNDLLIGNAAQNVLRGWDGDDRLFGRDGNDILLGEHGSDVLDGGYGNDVLIGWAVSGEYDTLFGGSGRDRFVFEGVGGAGAVHDFVSGEDTLDLSAYAPHLIGNTSATSILDSAVEVSGRLLLTLRVEVPAGIISPPEYGEVHIFLDGITRSQITEADILL